MKKHCSLHFCCFLASQSICFAFPITALFKPAFSHFPSGYFLSSAMTNHMSRYETGGRYSTCGPRALLLICEQEKVYATLPELCARSHTRNRGASLAGLAEAARSVGLKAVGVKMDFDAICALKKPAIAWVDGNHYVAVLSVTGLTACIHDPNKLRKEIISIETLSKRSQGIFLLLSRR